MIYLSCFVAWKDCNSILISGISSSGTYLIQSQPSVKNLMVYCDLETDNHGWTVIQRRVDVTTDFNRLWYHYKKGFGDMENNFWLGLDKMHLLTAAPRKAILRVDLRFRSQPYSSVYAEYDIFSVGDESTMYQLTLSGYNKESTLPDAMVLESWGEITEHNGMMFSTIDKDNDADLATNCAQLCSGGWWFNNCHSVYLNGLYPTASNAVNCDDTRTLSRIMAWRDLSSESTPCDNGIIFSEMKIRYKD